MKSALLALTLLVLSIPVAAGAVTVRVQGEDFDFASDDDIQFRFDVLDAQGLTGLEFSIVYPSDLLAVAESSSHSLFPVFSHAFVNHEADSSDLPEGLSRIRVALAVAQPISNEGGWLMIVTFPLRCSDFSGAWPDGRAVQIEVQDVAAWKALDSEVPVPVAATGLDVTVNVNCTTVPVGESGFSVLKARHVGRGGDR